MNSVVRHNNILVIDESIDSDAIAYFNAGFITDATEMDAVNKLIKTYKGININGNNPLLINIWPKITDLWLVSPTSILATHLNVKRLSIPGAYVGSPVFSDMGIFMNGVDQYFNTNIVPTTHLTFEDTHFFVYFRTNPDITDRFIFGAQNGSGFLNKYQLQNTNNNIGHVSDLYSVADRVSLLGNFGDATGWIGINRSLSSSEIIKNNSIIGSVSSPFSGNLPPNIPIYICALNQNGNPILFRSTYFAGGCAGLSLSQNEINVLYNAMQTYQATVIPGGREV